MASYKLTAKAAQDFARLYRFGIDVFGRERADQYTEDMEQRFLYIANNRLMLKSLGYSTKKTLPTILSAHHEPMYHELG